MKAMRKLPRILALTSAAGAAGVVTLLLSARYNRHRNTKVAAGNLEKLGATSVCASVTKPVVVYDGDCGICEAAAQWVTTHVTSVDVVSHYQHGLGSIDSVWFVTEDERLEGAQAVSAILREADSRFIRMLGVTIGLPGVLFIAKRTYSLVARNRRRISQTLGMNACGLPQRATTAEQKKS